MRRERRDDIAIVVVPIGYNPDSYISSLIYRSESIHPRRRRLRSPRLLRLTRRLHPLRLALLLRKRIATAHQHTTHHIKHGITLARNFDAEIHLANLQEGLFPCGDFFEVRGVVLFEGLEEVGGAALDGEEQEAEEIEEGQGGVDADVAGGAGDALDAEAWVGCTETGGEEEEGLVCCSCVAD